MTQHYKFIMPVLIAVFGGVWIGHSLKTGKNEDQNTSNQHLAASSARNTDNNILVDQLQQQILALQNENRLLLQQLQTQSPPHTLTQSSQQHTSISSETNQLLQDKLHALEMERQLRKANDFGNWVMEAQRSNTRFELNGELSHRFAQENREPVWAEQQEIHFRQLFTNKEELRGFAFRDAECRSTQCEITVSVSNSEQSQQLLRTMSTALQDSVVLLAIDEQQGISRLYISSSEKGFEFN